MRTLRTICAVAGLAIAVASATIGRPQVFTIVMPCALALFVIGTGLLVSDCIPLQRRRLTGSVAAVAAAPVIVVTQSTAFAGILAGTIVAVLETRGIRG